VQKSLAGTSLLAFFFFTHSKCKSCLFSKATSTPGGGSLSEKKQNRIAALLGRSRTKKTRLEDAERRDVPFFTRRKRVLRKETSFFARGVCARFFVECVIFPLFLSFVSETKRYLFWREKKRSLGFDMLFVQNPPLAP
jgi:hypothetical protein